MNPVTFALLVLFSLLGSLLLLAFAPELVQEHGFELLVAWVAFMALYVACAYLWAWLEDIAAAREQEELERWRQSLKAKHGPRGWMSTDLE